MRKQLFQLSLLTLSLGACKWTEFDDLRDEAWVHATSKPDGSKSANWGVAIVRGKATSSAGGRLAVFGSAASRLNEIEYDENGVARQLAEQNLGNIGIGNLSVEPFVIGDPATDDFALVTQGSAQQVVVAAGGDSNLLQFIINGANSVDAAAYLRAPAIDTVSTRGARTAQPAQPIIAAGNALFGTYFVNPDAPGAFNQVKCEIVDGGTPIAIRALGAVPAPEDDGTDDLAVWTANGSMILLDGHVFNGARSFDDASETAVDAVCPSGVLDISVAGNVLATPVDIGFTPDAGSLSQILAIDDRFALIHGHTGSDSFLAVWDFGDPVGRTTAGAIVGSPVAEAGLRSVALYSEDGANLHAVAGYPNAIIDGVEAGKVHVYPVSTGTGVTGTQVELLHDSEPEDGLAFGRSVAVIEYNGLPVISVAGNNEVFTYFRTPNLYNTDRRQGR
jgi:hypothetical protein